MVRAAVVRVGLLSAACLLFSAGCDPDDGDDDNQVEENPVDVGDAAVPPDARGPAPTPDAARPDAAVADARTPTPQPDGGGGSTLPPGCEVLINDSDCDKTKRPIVFVHGTTANGESFAHPALLLASNGYCPDRIRAVEYHSLLGFPVPAADAGTGDAGSVRVDGGMDGGLGGLDAGAPDAAARDAGSDAGSAAAEANEARYRGAKAAIDALIEELRRETGADKVDLAGHSQGAGHGSRYVRENPDKVAHYIHMAGQELTADPGGVPTLCLSSTGDRVLNCKTTKNHIWQDVTLDHAAVSSSTQAFTELYKFLNDGREPRYKQVQCGSPIVLEGKAPTFGDNKFIPGSKIEVFELGAEPRMRGTPVKTFEIGGDGKFGPWEAKRGVHYEFKLVPPAGDPRRPRHSYMRPFVRSDRLLRLTFESLDPVASATGRRVNYDPGHSVVVIRRRQKAFLYLRDTLKIDGRDVLNGVNARQGEVTCAIYVYDGGPMGMGPGDKVTTGNNLISATFLKSADFFLPTMTPAFIDVMFDGESLRIPNWASENEGLSLVLVD